LTLVIPNLRDYDFSKYSEEKSYFVNNELHGVDTIYSKSNYLGFYSSDLFVTDFVKEESPAKLAGIEKGDRIVAINGVIIRDFSSLQYIIDLKGRESEALELLIERNDSLLVIKVSPESHEIKDETIGLKEKRFLVGIQTHYYPGPSDSKDLIIRNPIKLISVSFINFIEWFWITVVGLFKLITGSVSVKALGGPVMIGKIAGDSFMMGFSYFIKIMAIISINLGIINLLPVPILDGGHIVFFTIEAITGKPVKEKYVERASQVGFYILMLLVALSFYNDIVRFGSKFLGIFK
jgi:regulator of sigma E protease